MSFLADLNGNGSILVWWNSKCFEITIFVKLMISFLLVRWTYRNFERKSLSILSTSFKRFNYKTENAEQMRRNSNVLRFSWSVRMSSKTCRRIKVLKDLPPPPPLPSFVGTKRYQILSGLFNYCNEKPIYCHIFFLSLLKFSQKIVVRFLNERRRFNKMVLIKYIKLMNKFKLKKNGGGRGESRQKRMQSGSVSSEPVC